MNINAVSMYTNHAQTNKTNGNNNSAFGNGCYYVAVPQEPKQDTFCRWAVKNCVAATVFSLAVDGGSNLLAKAKLASPVPAKEMLTNVPKVAGLFLLLGAVFKGVNNFIDNNY